MMYYKNAKAAVASSQKLASEVGIDIIRQGGSAVDAAISMAALLTLIEPNANGLGGDCFAIVSEQNKIFGLNSSGYSPQALSLKTLKNKNLTAIPMYDWEAVTVPGQVAGWFKLHKHFGRLPMHILLEPAIHYSKTGFPVAPITASRWALALNKPVAARDEFQKLFIPNGRTPKAGEIFKNLDLAQSLEIIAKDGESGFYKTLADSIVQYSRLTNGYFSHEDFGDFKSLVVEPLSINYRGVDVWELPPNGQGVAALMALKMAENFPLNNSIISEAERLHILIESLRLSFSDTYAHVADPTYMKLNYKQMLNAEYLQKRAQQISLDQRMDNVKPGVPPGSGTVYVCAADSEGLMVSFIQSNYRDFGSGIVIPGTGILMQNRGSAFSLDPASPNCLAPRKRPFHTIIPGYLSKNSKALGVFGLVGAEMQPQGHALITSHILDKGLDPQQALDFPRIRVTVKDKLTWEPDFSNQIISHLERLGHTLEKASSSMAEFGGGQIIMRDLNSGLYQMGSDHRKDGCALGIY